MGGFWQDVRYGLRMLAKRPGFTTVAVLTLALGIGASTGIFSVVYGVLLRPLPYPQPERIMQVWQVNDRGGHTNLSDPNFQDLHDQDHGFQAMAEYATETVDALVGGQPMLVRTAVVSRKFFDVMEVKPAIGRTFDSEEMRQNGVPAVIVSDSFWKRYLGGNADLSGQHIIVSHVSRPVIGVMPPGFHFPARADVWGTREYAYPVYSSRTAQNWHVVGRLKDSVPVVQARTELSGIARRLKKQYGNETWMEDAAVVPLREQMVGKVRPALLILLGAVGFLLLIACVNVVNLLLVRAATRQKELAVRAALGAGRGRLVRQFLTESLLLSFAGGGLGVLASSWGVDALLALEPGNLPRASEVSVNLPVLAFAVGLAIVSAIALGLFTALRGTGRGLQESLQEGGRTLASRQGRRLRSTLVGAQMAITLVLLVGAGLLGHSFLRLLAVPPGFRTDQVLTMELTQPSPSNAAASARIVRFHEGLLARLRALPGVQQAGGVDTLPTTASGTNGQFIILSPGENVSSMDDFVQLSTRLAGNRERLGYAEYRAASGGYFGTMAIPLLRGRLFDERDGPDAPHVALISESLARQQWPKQNPIGQRIEFGNMDGDLRPITVVGIVGDVRDYGLDAPVRPTLYVDYRQRPQDTGSFTMVMHTAADSAALISAAREFANQLDPEVPIRFSSVAAVLSDSLAGRRFSLLLMGVFAAAALLLAVVGVYGLMAYSVAQRTREIGIRMALGASPWSVVRLILRQGWRLLLAGLATGLVLAFALSRVMTSLLFEIRAADPLTYAGVAALLGVVALVACYLAARRATLVDPIVALRYE